MKRAYIFFLSMLLLLFSQALAAAPVFRTINGNPLQVHVGDDTSFQVFNSAIPGSGQIYPTGATQTADMGIFVRRAGTLYAPDFGNHPGGSAAAGWLAPYTPWTPVSISTVSGAGTIANPFTVTVIADAGATGLRLTMTVTYVNGDNFFRKALVFSSTGAQTFDAFLGADLYLANSDLGVPYTTSGAVGGQNCVSPATWTILLIPLTAADGFSAGSFSAVWEEIKTGALSNLIAPGCQDNGAALQWEDRIIPAGGGSVQIQAATSFGTIPAIATFRVNSVTPNKGQQGQNLPVTVAGLGFQAGTTFSFGSGITVNSTTINSATQATLNLSINGAATPGFRNVVGTQVPFGLSYSLTNGFEVLSATPDLTLGKAHSGNFARGQNAATYTLTVNNVGNVATSGTVTVVDTLPAGLSFVSGAGPGWGCAAVGQTVTCTRSTPLTAASNSTITLTVNVAPNAPGSVVNTASVGCSCAEVNTANNSASDLTVIVASPPTVITGAANAITPTGATLNGTVSSNGASTTATFEYGLTASYGSGPVPALPSPLAGGATNAAVSSAITGLTCNKMYHFRALGTNSAGSGTGADATFTTMTCPTTSTTTSVMRTDDPDRPFVLIFTATVAGNAPTRTVGFADTFGAASRVNTVCGAQSLGGGGNTARASCEPGSLSNGMHSITAMYGGDAANAPSMSAPLPYPVNPPGPAAVTKVTPGNGDAKVEVAAPADDGGTPVTGFTVTTTSGAGVDRDAGSLASAHVVTQLTNGVTYTFLATASNAAGTGVPSPPSDVAVPLGGIPSSYSANYVQKAYVAYYGRPADPVGHDYWSRRMDAEGKTLDAIIAAFGTSEEFTRRYGGLTYTQLVTRIYQQALGRDPDPGGLAYYVGELEAGRRTLQAITLDVLNGATTAPDAIVVSNRLEVAAYYMERAAAGCGNGSLLGGEQDGVDTLSVVTANAATVLAAKVDIDIRCPPIQ